MIITEDPARAAQVSRTELGCIDLDYLLSLGFHPVEITAVGLRFIAGAMFRPAVRGFRPRVAPPAPRRMPAPPPPPRPHPGRIPAGRPSPEGRRGVRNRPNRPGDADENCILAFLREPFLFGRKERVLALSQRKGVFFRNGKKMRRHADRLAADAAVSFLSFCFPLCG